MGETLRSRKATRAVGDGPCARAGEGIRTLDMQLGKLPLYQLSYTREEVAMLPEPRETRNDMHRS